MKKFLKISGGLIVGISLMIGGGVAWLRASGRRLQNGSIMRLTTKQVALTNNPSRIQVTTGTAVVHVKTGTQPSVKIANMTAGQFHVKTQAGRLEIKQPHSAGRVELGRSANIVITVRPKQLQQLKITQRNGTIRLNDLTVRHLEIQHLNGSTLASHLTLTGTSTLDKVNGSTTLNQLRSSGLIVRIKNGQFKKNNQKRAGNGQVFRQSGVAPLVITSKNGQVKVSD